MLRACVVHERIPPCDCRRGKIESTRRKARHRRLHASQNRGIAGNRRAKPSGGPMPPRSFRIAWAAAAWLLAAGHPLAQTPPPAVVVAPVEVSELRESAGFTGRVVATQKVEIRARVAGFLEEMTFHEGAEGRGRRRPLPDPGRGLPRRGDRDRGLDQGSRGRARARGARARPQGRARPAPGGGAERARCRRGPARPRRGRARAAERHPRPRQAAALLRRDRRALRRHRRPLERRRRRAGRRRSPARSPR